MNNDSWILSPTIGHWFESVSTLWWNIFNMYMADATMEQLVCFIWFRSLGWSGFGLFSWNSEKTLSEHSFNNTDRWKANIRIESHRWIKPHFWWFTQIWIKGKLHVTSFVFRSRRRTWPSKQITKRRSSTRSCMNLSRWPVLFSSSSFWVFYISFQIKKSILWSQNIIKMSTYREKVSTVLAFWSEVIIRASSNTSRCLLVISHRSGRGRNRSPSGAVGGSCGGCRRSSPHCGSSSGRRLAGTKEITERTFINTIVHSSCFTHLVKIWILKMWFLSLFHLWDQII